VRLSCEIPMSSTTILIPDTDQPNVKVVEGSDGLLLEIDGQIVPNYDATLHPFAEGDVVTGHVVRIDNDEVLVDIGYKSEGVIPASELSIRKSVDPSDEVELGEEVDALVLTKEDQDGRLILSKKRARFEKAWRRIEAAAESGEPVEGAVIEVVKGGLIIDLGVRGFLPASLVDIRRVPNLDEYMGQAIECKVIELNRSRNNVVLSRRAVLEEQRKEDRERILDRLQPGQVVEGTISNIVDFGAFVDLDGIDGLIHISELSWSHVNHPSEILSIGDTVSVKVLDIDRQRQRISLGLKQTQEDPWQRVVDTYNIGDELEGNVTKVVTFGAFVEILDGVEGLVHISELAQHHVENPREIIQPGDPVRVKILEIDSERRRLSLSIKRVEGQVLPVRPIVPPSESDGSDLDDVPELGLSEDVFVESAGADSVAESTGVDAESAGADSVAESTGVDSAVLAVPEAGVVESAGVDSAVLPVPEAGVVESASADSPALAAPEAGVVESAGADSIGESAGVDAESAGADSVAESTGVDAESAGADSVAESTGVDAESAGADSVAESTGVDSAVLAAAEAGPVDSGGVDSPAALAAPEALAPEAAVEPQAVAVDVAEEDGSDRVGPAGGESGSESATETAPATDSASVDPG
jgi:small subunit ribosomal protein S1